MNKSNINEQSAGTEADSNSTAQNQQVSQPNANTNVVRSCEDVFAVMDDYLQEVNNDDEVRLERINELMDFLSYNKRLTALSAAEKLDFVHCMEGYPLSEKQRKALDENPEKQDYYITMWARSNYFRRCAWLSYLHGEDDYKPSVNAEVEIVTA